MILKDIIENILIEAREKAVSEGTLPQGEYPAMKVEYPRDASFGDYATPFAMEAARIVRRNPLKTGELLAEYIRSHDIIESVEVVKPGFINMFISRDYLFRTISQVLSAGEAWGRSTRRNPRRYNIEFVSANPTGPLNVVSARAAALGDTLAKLLDAAGDTVEKEFYINDHGNQVRLLGLSTLSRIREIQGEATEFPEEGYQGEYVYDIAHHIIENYSDELGAMESEDEKADYCARRAIEFNVAGQQRDMAAFNVEYHRWFSERSLHEEGKVDEARDTLSSLGVLYEEEGKTFFRSSDFGDDKDRVVVRDDGRPTYLMADIAYHNNKLQRGYDQIIDIWGPDHHGYIARLAGAMKALGADEDTFRVLIAQQVNLIMEGESVRMSKRLGNFSTMRDLVDEIGTDVARYFFVMRSMDSHLDFDLTLAKKESSENPVFYLQYAHARIASIFREAEKRGIPWDSASLVTSHIDNTESLVLLKLLAQFPEEVRDAADAREPHRIPVFLMKLAQSFHRFYTEHRILTDNAEEASTRLALAKAVQTVMKNGLTLLGVRAPESM